MNDVWMTCWMTCEYVDEVRRDLTAYTGTFAAPSLYYPTSLTVSSALVVLAKRNSAREGILGDKRASDVLFSRNLSIVRNNRTQLPRC